MNDITAFTERPYSYPDQDFVILAGLRYQIHMTVAKLETAEELNYVLAFARNLEARNSTEES